MTRTFDRVRVRMTRLINSGRDRLTPIPPSGVVDDGHPATGASPDAPAPDLSPLVADLRTLEQIIEDSEKLMRQAWNVAGDLNHVRRECSHCAAVGVLAEALGTFQGLLNRCRHNLRAATRAVDDMKATVSGAKG